MSFTRLFRSTRHERAGFALYTTAVTAARAPYFYATLGVPDTLDGRFDLVGLHTFLVIRRLRGTRGPEPATVKGPGPALAQAVFDAMFADMDINLREIGVGDLSVGKRVRAMWEAFHGRSVAYESALVAGDASALAAALERNVWRGVTPPAGAPASLAALVIRQDAHLRTQTLVELAAGRMTLLPPDEAAGAGVAP